MMRHRAFTLIELLVTITIIGILAGAILGGLAASKRQARIRQTQATIAKIDSIVSEQWGSYQTRRLPADIGAIRNDCTGPVALTQPDGTTYTAVRLDIGELQRALLNLRRDLVRMEMPDRWSDVTEPPLLLDDTPGRALVYRRLRERALDRGMSESVVNGYASPELLYMIVTTGRSSDIKFHDREIGDIDGDGLKEFHDAWGQPIAFVRWPAGFLGEYEASDSLIDPSQPDPYDPHNATSCYALHPLVFSPGPDGQYDINRGTQEGDTYAYRLDPDGNIDTCCRDENDGGYLIGQPLDSTTPDGSEADGNLGHHDNIHNHALHR